MNRRHLRYFVAIAGEGGFTAASRRLNVSQPALLYQMNELEEIVGARLFIRHSRGVSLTASGNAFLQAAQALLQQYDLIEEAATPFRDASADVVRMGFVPTAARVIAPDFVTQFASERPGLKISLRQALSARLVSLVLRGELDCAFCFNVSDAKGRFIPLFKEDLYIVGPRQEVDTLDGDIPFTELVRLKLVIDSEFHTTRTILDQTAEREGIVLDISLESNLTDFTRELVRFHGSTTIAPRGLYADILEINDLGMRRIVGPTVPLVGGIVFRPGFPRELRQPIEARLSQLVQEHVARDDLGWHAP